MVSDSNVARPCFTRLTGSGRGAIAVIKVQAPDLAKSLDSLFAPVSSKPLATLFSEPLVYGNWLNNGQPSEDLIVCPTSRESAEIHCHGGDAAVSAIETSLESAGFRRSSPEIHVDGWKSGIRRALTQAKTVRTAKILLRMLENLDHNRKRLVQGMRSNSEAALDSIRQGLAHAEFGRHLTEPWKVVLTGLPNVGKSSLVNSIVGFERAIVHETAGTTRDVVTEVVALDGWPIQLSDTAGLREAGDAIERKGIERAYLEIENADLVVYVFDAVDRQNHSIDALIAKGALIVVNKSDLSTQEFSAEIEQKAIVTSATSGSGVQKLIGAISSRLVPEVPSEDFLIPVNREQEASLEQVLESLEVGNVDSAIGFLSE